MTVAIVAEKLRSSKRVIIFSYNYIPIDHQTHLHWAEFFADVLGLSEREILRNFNEKIVSLGQKCDVAESRVLHMKSFVPPFEAAVGVGYSPMLTKLQNSTILFLSRFLSLKSA